MHVLDDWLTIVGGPAPYRDAIERAYRGDILTSRNDSIEVLAEKLEVRVFVIFCGRESHRQSLVEIAEAPNTYAIAIVPDLDISLYHWALNAGASGVLFEDNPVEYLCDVTVAALHHDVVVPREVLRALLRPEIVAAEPTVLSATGHAVLTCIASGLTVPQIAEQLHLNKRTVQRRITNLCLEVGAKTPTECVHLAHKAGLLD